VKESRNAFSILLIKLALMMFDLDLFAMVLGHVCANVTLASRDGNFGTGTAFRLSGLLWVNCKAELWVTCYLIGGIQNLLQQKPWEGAKTDFQAKFGKETVAGAHRRPKWVPHYGAQANSGRAQDTQALLRLYSGSSQALVRLWSPLAQVKAAVAHVRRLKRIQRKGKLILSLWVLHKTKFAHILLFWDEHL